MHQPDFLTLFDGPGRTVPRGERIFQPGDTNQRLFLLRSGLVKLSKLSVNGDEITFRVYRPDEVFGEFCFCGAAQRYCATALEPSEVLEATLEKTIDAFGERPELAVRLVSDLAERLVSAYDELHAISSSIVVVRLAAKLLTLPAVHRSNDSWVELGHRFTHEELAQLVAVRRETLTRALTRLKALGLVEHAQGGPMRVHRSGLRDFLVVQRSS